MKALNNFIKSVRKVGWKETWKQLKYNFVMLESPEQLLKIEITGFAGALFGTLFAFIYLLVVGMWYITIAVGFSVLITYSGLKQKLQQRQQLENIKKLAEELQNEYK